MRALGTRLDCEVGEHLVRDPQLFPSAQAPKLTAEPLAVEQVRAGQVDRDSRAR